MELVNAYVVLDQGSLVRYADCMPTSDYEERAVDLVELSSGVVDQERAEPS